MYIDLLAIILLTLMAIANLFFVTFITKKLLSAGLFAAQSNRKIFFWIKNHYYYGDNMSKESRMNIAPEGDAIGIVVGDNNNLEGVFTKTDGDVANVANQVPEVNAANIPSERIKTLLAQLHQQIESQPEITPTDKANALEQIKTLASLSSVDFIPFVEHEADISTPEPE